LKEESRADEVIKSEIRVVENMAICADGPNLRPKKI